MLDLHAPIEPGKSAAGFRIGQQWSSVEPLLQNVEHVDYFEGFGLNAAIAENRGVLVVRGFGHKNSITVYFEREVVRLQFWMGGLLGCIYVFDGYRGTYKGISVGQPLSLLSSAGRLEFNQGDDMYYRVDDESQYLAGIGVVASEADLSEHSSVHIDGYCVHDWKIFRGDI